ncbi:MAG: hypothetical protein IKM89_09475 [Bacteroidales bacterium]|nr:hypothetical protein [Bacteroidales bacterium]
MNDKEKYLELMQRYFDAETSPDEEKALALYAASTDDPAFRELRGVLGYLSIGRQKKAKKIRTVRFFSMVAAASVAIVTAIGITLSNQRQNSCIRYTYGNKEDDETSIMESVESSLADFFAGNTPAESNLFELFER